MPISNERLLKAIDEAREHSYGPDENSELGERRSKAIEAYLGLNTNPAPEGRSQVVDRTVYQTISTIMPSLVKIFASSTEEICKFVPVGPEDEPAAEQTTMLVNHVVTQMNPWEQICGDWIHDAALLCNGYALAYWDESEKKTREKYQGQSDDQIAMLMQDSDVTILEHSQYEDEEGTALAMQAYQQSIQAGQMIPPPEPLMLHDVTIERVNKQGKVCIKVLPPEHCTVSEDTPNWLLKDCPFFEYREQKTIADLRAMGLEVTDDISDNEDADSLEDDARNRFAEDEDDSGLGAMRRVWTRMTWVMADAEDDGETRLYYCIVVGRSVLFAEATSRIHVASMTPQPLPHRHIGLSIAETVLDIQDTKTAIKRGGLDNLYLMNNGRHVVSSRVSLEDFLDARPGGVVRMLDDSLPAEGHVVPLTHPVAFDQIIGTLEYFDQDSQNRSGASRYFAGTDAGAINKTAAGTIALQNMASMRVEHIARLMAPAVEELFSIVHELLLKHQSKPLTVKLSGKWTTVDPQAWRTKRDVRISVGVGAGNKESMMAQLNNVLATQVQVGLPMGLVGRENIHATNVEILKLAGFANPQKFWPDPQTLPPQQPPPNPEQIKAQAKQQEMQFAAQQDAMKFQAEQQAEERRAQMQAELDRNREEMQARQKALEAQSEERMRMVELQAQQQAEASKLMFEKWKVELQETVKVALHQSAQAQSAEQNKPDTRIDGVAETLKAISEAIADMGQPPEFIRGADGRISHVKRGNRVQAVERDESGRARRLH